MIDRPPRNESRGDVVNFRYTLRTGRGVAGSAFVHYRYTSRSRVRITVRLRFRDGTVLARGALSANADRLRVRIIGGTGAFRGSGGMVEARDAAGDNARLVLRLR